MGEERTDPNKRFIDDQEFTGFNLEEEREEGKFTKDGRFEWHLDEDEKRGADEWLNDVNWRNVDNMDDAKRSKYRAKFERDQEVLNNDGAITYTKSDVIDSLERVLGLILAHENVAKALKRLRPASKLSSKKQQV